MKVIGCTTAELRQKYGKTPEESRAFALGFAVGQIEKICLGVCSAAMFRPGPDIFDWYLTEVRGIADHYGLWTSVFPSYCAETPNEIWVHHRRDFGSWLTCEPNSPEWHRLRGEACGIPLGNIDVNYHLRDGYGIKCD